MWHDGQVAGYADSIESLVRNNIQKMKIDMANEVIDAGRFDMNTTMDERRHTLEEMLQVHFSLLALLLILRWPFIDSEPAIDLHDAHTALYPFCLQSQHWGCPHSIFDLLCDSRRKSVVWHSRNALSDYILPLDNILPA